MSSYVIELPKPYTQGLWGRDEMSKIIKVLDTIIADCEQDVKDFDGRELAGTTMIFL